MEMSVNTRSLFALMFIAILTLGMAIEYLFGIYKNNLKREVIYISQEEILQMEKKRVKSSGLNKTLFYGRVNEAMKLIEEVAESYNSDNKTVVFSISKIYGRGVRSISKEVYLDIMDKLQIKEKN